MARRRLGSANPAFLGGPLETKSMPPIAQVAGEAAGVAALDEITAALRAARAEGRMVLELPLEEIAEAHFTRDRVTAEDEGLAELKASIAAHGQRQPIEVMILEGGGHALISGWRRLTALKALHAETGEARFARVRALAARPRDAADAYVAMVEENEIRQPLSYYERARIAVKSAEAGVFADTEAALGALYANASKARRSKIRSFTRLVEALDGALRWPQAIPERLGLALVERLKEGAGLAAELSQENPHSVQEEQALLTRLAAPPKAEKPLPERRQIGQGVFLSVREGRGRAVLTLDGPGLTKEQLDRLIAALEGQGGT